MLEYFITILLSVFFAFLAMTTKNEYKENGQKKYKMLSIIFMVLSALIPIIITGFRDYSIGTDTSGTYYDIYNKTLQNAFRVRDIGYYGLNKIAIIIYQNYTTVLILNAVLFYGIIYYTTYKESKNIPLSILFLFIMNIFFIFMNMTRQSIATAFFILSIPCIKEKKMIKFLILNAIGFSFHSTAILYIPFYFLYNIKIPKNIRNIILITIGLVVLEPIIIKVVLSLLSKIRYFNYYFAWYLNSTYNNHQINKISLLISLCLFVFSIICYNSNKDKDTKLCLELSWISLLLLTASPLLPLMQRTSWLFTFPLFLYLPNSIKAIASPKKRKPVTFLIIFFYTLYMIFTIFILGYHEVIPYKFIWEVA